MLIRFVTILLIFSIIIAAIGCQKESEQDKVRKVITDIQKAAEEKDVQKIMDNLSKNYSDHYGFNHETIRRPLLGYFFRYPKISVYITNLDITIENASARTAFRTVLTSTNRTGSAVDLVPESLGMYNFNVLLQKEQDGWKVTSAAWIQAEIMKTGESED